MPTRDVQSSDARESPRVNNVDLKLEVIVVPVADVDRAHAFYRGLGWVEEAS